MKNFHGRDRGMALIMVLVMVIIFSSLILAVVISSSTAIRRAHYHKDKTIALQIAESGIQDALYWLNYTGYPERNYPSAGDMFFRGSDYAGTDTWLANSDVRFNPTSVPQGSCRLRLRVTEQANSDTVISTGFYRGRTAEVRVVLRGTNRADTQLLQSSQGVAEAFNKKALYSSYVDFPGNPLNTSLTGNVTTITGQPVPFPWDQATWTETQNVSMPFLSPDSRPDDPSQLAPGLPSVPATVTVYRFKDDNGEDPYAQADIIYEPDTTLSFFGVDYAGDGTNETYTFGTGVEIGNGVNQLWQFEKADVADSVTLEIKDGFRLNAGSFLRAGAASGEQAHIDVDYTGATLPELEGVLLARGGITVRGNGGTYEIGQSSLGNIALWAGGGLTLTGPGEYIFNGDIYAGSINFSDTNITGVTINGNVFCAAGANFTNATVNIEGDLYAGGNIALNAASVDVGGDVTAIGTVEMNAGTVFTAGSLTSCESLTLRGSITIDSSGSDKKGAVILWKDADATLELDIGASTLDLTLGDEQVAAFMVFFRNPTTPGRRSNITVSQPVAFSGEETFFIANHSATGRIDINANITGSVYSGYFFFDTANPANPDNFFLQPVNVSNGRMVEGSLVTNGTVHIADNAGIIYDPVHYANPDNSEIFRGFYRGRRRYLPLPRSWEIRW